jgi:hypothetical protein
MKKFLSVFLTFKSTNEGNEAFVYGLLENVDYAVGFFVLLSFFHSVTFERNLGYSRSLLMRKILVKMLAGNEFCGLYFPPFYFKSSLL